MFREQRAYFIFHFFSQLLRMQLRSKFTVATFASHTNKKLKQSEQILSSRITSNEKIVIENEPVSTSVSDSNDQNHNKNTPNKQNQSVNNILLNIPNESDISGNEVQEESVATLSR